MTGNSLRVSFPEIRLNQLENESNKKIVSINQSSNLESSTDNFDTDTYERTIKENFGTAIANEIILVLNSMK